MSQLTPAHISYFGYGSLVNLDTLRTPYISAHRARLKGWRRTWLARPKTVGGFAPIDGLAFLSVEVDHTCEIDGLIIVDHRTSLQALDEREALYDRVEVNRSQVSFLDGDPLADDVPIYLYVAQSPAAPLESKILRSYLDAVMQGYLTHFGEVGVQSFLQTTGNSNLGLMEDRDSPLYPRPVELSPHEVELFSTLFPGGVTSDI